MPNGKKTTTPSWIYECFKDTLVVEVYESSANEFQTFRNSLSFYDTYSICISNKGSIINTYKQMEKYIHAFWCIRKGWSVAMLFKFMRLFFFTIWKKDMFVVFLCVCQ